MIWPATPDRLPHGKRHRLRRHRQHLTVDLGGQAAVVLETGGGVVHVVLGLRDGLARIPGLQLGQLGPASADPVRQTEENAPPLLGRDAFPSFIEGLCGCPDRPIDVFGIAGGAGGNGLLGGRIVDVEGLPALRVDELAIDVHLVGGDL